jgi:hypothetical protein
MAFSEADLKPFVGAVRVGSGSDLGLVPEDREAAANICCSTIRWTSTTWTTLMLAGGVFVSNAKKEEIAARR